ncbi:MAG: PEP-CTERM sorting domain-containing protein [Methyloversatilis sp.]|jgi:hypothetical protein|nr:PEP-CTERM sorting domain-containing protein [Methyloversatilis sp.]
MKFASSIAAFALGALAMQGAQAGTFTLNLTADDGSRFYDHISGVYGELGTAWGEEITNEDHPDFGYVPDGSFLIGSGTPVGGGTVYFPNLGNFFGIGSIAFDDLTGVITGVTMPLNAFSRFVADDDGNAADSYGSYLTYVTSFSGTVDLNGGVPSAIDLDVGIRFSYGNALDYEGSFSIDGGSFALAVDDFNMVTTPFGTLPLRYQWDVTGSVNGLAPAVPEPETYALMLAGLGLIAGAARRSAARG